MDRRDLVQLVDEEGRRVTRNKEITEFPLPAGGALALALHLDCAHHLKKATGRGRWLLVLKCVALLTSKAKAREPLASPPLPRQQDVRQPAIARRLRAGPRIGA